MRGNHYESERPSYWYPRQGEVYLCEMDKVRPAIVVSSNSENQSRQAAIVVPLSTKNNDSFGRSFALTAVDTGLDSRSWAKLLLAKEISHDEILGSAKGSINPAKLQELIRLMPFRVQFS
jgi:mRNA-degrading endonuclease toxin of MazEF toxin-antitoxin module